MNTHDFIIEEITCPRRPHVGPVETVEQFLARGGKIKIVTDRVPAELRPKRSKHWGFGSPERRTSEGRG